MAGELFQVSAMLVVGTAPLLILQSLPGIPTLRIEWLVQKQIGPIPDTAEVTVYNLDLPARKALSVAMALPVPIQLQLHVGWGLLPELVFSGSVAKCKPERRTGTDVLTNIVAGDGLAALRDTPPDGGALIGYTMGLAVKNQLFLLGLTPSPAAMAVVEARGAASPVKTFQLAQDQGPAWLLDQILATIGLSWGIDRGMFVVFQGGLRNDVPPVLLTPLHGLLAWDELEDGGVAFTALAQPMVVPGAQITILIPPPFAVGLSGLIAAGGGPLRVERVEFRGSTEGESVMTGIARKVTISAKGI